MKPNTKTHKAKTTWSSSTESHNFSQVLLFIVLFHSYIFTSPVISDPATPSFSAETLLLAIPITCSPVPHFLHQSRSIYTGPFPLRLVCIHLGCPPHFPVATGCFTLVYLLKTFHWLHDYYRFISFLITVQSMKCPKPKDNKYLLSQRSKK